MVHFVPCFVRCDGLLIIRKFRRQESDFSEKCSHQKEKTRLNFLYKFKVFNEVWIVFIYSYKIIGKFDNLGNAVINSLLNVP